MRILEIGIVRSRLEREELSQAIFGALCDPCGRFGAIVEGSYEGFEIRPILEVTPNPAERGSEHFLIKTLMGMRLIPASEEHHDLTINVGYEVRKLKVSDFNAFLTGPVPGKLRVCDVKSLLKGVYRLFK